MYDYQASVRAIDAHWPTILPCIAGAVIGSFIYFTSAVRQARREKVYTEAFLGASVFFWHDLSFVLHFPLWFGVYNHWWFKSWTFALVGTVAFEAWLIYVIYQYGHRELWPSLSKRAFGAALVLGTLAVGAMWWVLKDLLNDELYFLSFAITAIWSAPFHTGLMCLRKSRAGQSPLRQLCMANNLVWLTFAFAQVDPYFKSPPFVAFAIAFTLWPLANIWLIRRLPPAPAAA
ncbi:hypothetical protein [Piscinibacter sp.]|uniref:hypothetical protein n=1 Tax=Piscinibacter sp. TaxID=1903157 RepID=UPI0039E4A02C